jgi:hypothetical protein
VEQRTTVANAPGGSSAASSSAHDAPGVAAARGFLVKQVGALTPFKFLVAQDAAILATLGALLLFAPSWASSASNWYAASMKVPAALVLKSDTSMMLVRASGRAPAGGVGGWGAGGADETEGRGGHDSLALPGTLPLPTTRLRLQLKVIGATQLAFASTILWRCFARNDTATGWTLWCVGGRARARSGESDDAARAEAGATLPVTAPLPLPPSPRGCAACSTAP